MTTPPNMANDPKWREKWWPDRQPTRAIIDVTAERFRQIEKEGWTPEHDDAHGNGEMSVAAACYAMMRPSYHSPLNGLARQIWPWSVEWWKPTDRRRNLVKAGALIVAEIERLDRAAARNPQT